MDGFALDLFILLFFTPIGWGVIILVIIGLVSACSSGAKKVAEKASETPVSKEEEQEAVNKVIQEVESDGR
jgi:F0F1-type ATP synthase assembly protein I